MFVLYELLRVFIEESLTIKLCCYLLKSYVLLNQKIIINENESFYEKIDHAFFSASNGSLHDSSDEEHLRKSY